MTPPDSQTAGRTHSVTLIPGDGIGPEVTQAVVDILDHSGARIAWDRQNAGAAVAEKTGTPLPEALLASIRSHRVALKGPVATPIGTGFSSVSVGLRKALDLYANVRPVMNLPGVETRFPGVDLVIVRENTEGLYTGLEHVVVPGVVESLRIITTQASTRIARFAFDYARDHARTRVTAVHKANILKLGDGLFLDATRRVAAEYPDLTYDERIVDATCAHLVMRPEQFDVLVLPNLYGDIISDLCAGLVGGLGLVPGANLGTDVALFEAVHGTAPDIAGQNVANPIALLLSALMLLQHIGEREAAARVRRALESVLLAGKVRTRDLGGVASTTEFARAVIQNIR